MVFELNNNKLKEKNDLLLRINTHILGFQADFLYFV